MPARAVSFDIPTADAEQQPTLDQKVRFLSAPASYPHRVGNVTYRETHMSWVFLAGERVYKLKKPVRFSYLDFSTLNRRESACRAELSLNRRPAPDVYLDVVPLTATTIGLSIGDSGTIVDWLVVMHRLDENRTLERAIEQQRVEPWQLDLLAETLVQFYRRVPEALISAALHLSDWHRSLGYNRRVLLNCPDSPPRGLVTRVGLIQRRFLDRHGKMLAGRVRRRCIVDGHGDLRPEHIWLGDPVKIIDCLEFNPRLRAVDPFDEIAFLSLECERLGARWAGEYIRRRVTPALHDGLCEELYLFYRCHRAMLRARLAIAHLLEPNPRTPDKWPRLARDYLRIAATDAARLERSLKTREGWSGRFRHAGAGSLPRAAARPAKHRSWPGPGLPPAEKKARHRSPRAARSPDRQEPRRRRS
jgi:aminoglycoside phosphotransferase family enzyme